MITKPCSKCGNTGEFYKDSKSKDGFQSHCKKCKLESIKKYYKTQKGQESLSRNERKRSSTRYSANRISFNISRRIRKSLGRDKGGVTWEDVVGYDLISLKSHLELKFQTGMNWNNYGEWHIDHIRPISSFNITSIDCNDFRSCWSLANLQPLWAKDNLSKGDSW